VEIDLHRGGQRLPMGEPTPPRADYYVMVCRAAEFPRTVIWPFSVRERLPEIPIPLKPEDRWIGLPLQPCFDWSYDQGPFQQEVEYGQAPPRALKGNDATWARALLRRSKH
jgi:hypothetical protein